MANYFKTAKAFSEQSKDLAEGIKAFAKDAILERKGDIRAFSAHSREEQNKLINKEFMAEVAKRSGYSLAEGASNTEAMRYASNPMVKYFANQIKTEMIDMILPEVLMNGALRYIAEFKYADLGDTISFDIENNTLFTVSKAGYRKRNTNIQKSFKTTVTMSGENHMITVGRFFTLGQGPQALLTPVHLPRLLVTLTPLPRELPQPPGRFRCLLGPPTACSQSVVTQSV